MNYVWAIMLTLSIFCALAFGKMSELSATIVSGGQPAVLLCLKLMGIITFWSGIMNIAEKSGLTKLISLALSPLLRLLFPKLKKGSPAMKAMSMNITANLLGLGSAATPFGLEAVSRLKEETKAPEGTASNEMVRFVVINTSALTLIPSTVAMLRSNYGSKTPLDIMLPAILTSLTAFFCAMVLTFLLEKGVKINAEGNRFHSSRGNIRNYRFWRRKGR